MPDKDGRPVRGEVGHWRYNKDTAAGNKFDKKGVLITIGPPEETQTGKNTSTKTPGFEKHGTPDPKGIFTKEVAKGFNKTEQRNLLKARGVKVLAKDDEPKLVEKILKSNPKGNQSDIPPEAPEEKLEEPYTQLELEDFKAKKLVEILKSLGVKRFPMTEKGRIKKILESQ